MNTETGFNASFVPDFSIVRDPQPIEPVLTDVVQVYDLIGLNINGYVDGKPYYGNVYYVNGIRYAGTSANSGTNIVVYDTQLASVQKKQIEGQIVASQIEETETQEDTIEAISSPTRGTYSTTPISEPSTTPATPSTTTTPATGGGDSTPSTPAPAPTTPSTPAPSTPSTPSGGGGGYGGGY